jgi:hypothetical protein
VIAIANKTRAIVATRELMAKIETPSGSGRGIMILLLMWEVLLRFHMRLSI